jgi:hypothetical protein
MSGELPVVLRNRTDLIIIDLRSNNFSGKHTKVDAYNLPNLETLDLPHNNFIGPIPESVYACSNLIALYMRKPCNECLNHTI